MPHALLIYLLAYLLAYRATQRDEMCNLYVMYYAEMPSNAHLAQITCSGVDQPGLLVSMPADSDAAPVSRPNVGQDGDQFSRRHHHPLLSG